MRAAAKELEFERAAALRDEIQQIRLRVLEQDASLIVGAGRGAGGAATRRCRRRSGPAAHRPGGARHAAERRRSRSRGHGPAGGRGAGGDAGRDRTGIADAEAAADLGIRDEHEDDGAGRRAGATGRPGTGPSRRTSARRTGQRPSPRAARGHWTRPVTTVDATRAG